MYVDFIKMEDLKILLWNVKEFNAVIIQTDDSVAVWEDGPNRTYKVENLTMTVIECDWNGPQTYWICKQSGNSNIFYHVHCLIFLMPGLGSYWFIMLPEGWAYSLCFICLSVRPSKAISTQLLDQIW